MADWDDVFEKEGEEIVRLKIQKNQYNSAIMSFAIAWLAQRELVSRLTTESTNAEHLEAARSAAEAAWDASKAAWDATRRAHTANVIATISMAITTILAIVSIIVQFVKT
ncbi:hypothetical protein [Sphingomonas sp. dw_22]|uniref:hypothetical protein n=1 Tax=Sphingomonas sp. dw_22 TaxID=2721175 RepID=UPI001BD407E2|nr:hypothetical protein [Sphingomonas sp. dw_22]